jgi:hypothetical protein
MTEQRFRVGDAVIVRHGGGYYRGVVTHADENSFRVQYDNADISDEIFLQETTVVTPDRGRA